MGIRAVDIQVAIQRAVDADKLQQGQTSVTKAGDAGVREGTELERLKDQQETNKSEKSKNLTLKPHREKEEQSSGSQQQPRSQTSSEQTNEDSTADPKNPRRKETRIDFLA